MKRWLAVLGVLLAGALLLPQHAWSQGTVVNDWLQVKGASPYIQLSNLSSGYTGTLQPATLTGNRTWTLPDASGTILLSSTIGTTAWLLTGNSITGTEFLGTTNAQPLVIRTNNTERLRVTEAGEVVVQNQAPTGATKVSIRAGANQSGVNLLEWVDDLGNTQGVIDANGLVGIGTTTPVQKLHVVGNGSVSAVFVEGGVGVGTVTPLATLHVYDAGTLTGATRVIIQAGANQSGVNLLEWQNSSGNILGVIDAGGLVGIGTASPTERLQVSDGNIAITNTDGTARQLRLYEPSGAGANFTAFQAQAQANDIIYTLPASLTPTSTVEAGILQTDAFGNLSWLDPSALGGGAGWALTGNSGTNPAVNFLGTTDAQPLVIRVGNQETFRFNPPGSSAPAWSIQRGGGDPRGLHAVDLQSARTAPTQVASGNYSVIGGGLQNTASGGFATVSGGALNTASGGFATVGGGSDNTASGSRATVGGGYINTASGGFATVGGGYQNTASGGAATVGGGYQNTASGVVATVGGGYINTASGNYATVGGGALNTASGDYSAIPGGYNLRVGARSFGFSGQTSTTETNLSGNSNIAAFVDVDLWLYNVRNQASQLRLYEPSGAGTNFTAFRAQAQASDIIYTLPASLTPTSVVGVGILQTDAFGNLSWLDPSALGGGGAGWALTGNSGTNPAVNFLGTTDAQPLVIRVGNQETFRFNPPGSSAPAWSIQRGGGNTRGLHAVDLQSARSAATQVASGDYSVIGGGVDNTASGQYATVGGGAFNTASGWLATVGGGLVNIASGDYATVGGGEFNTASSNYATVGGGADNTASGALATVGGGARNTASGDYSAIPGGYNLRVGDRSFGFSGQTSAAQTDLSANSNIAAFVDVDLWLYSRDHTQASQLRFYEAQAHGSGANYVALRAPTSLSANTTYTLPASLTPTSTVGAGILQTDAFGNLSWLDPSALGGGGAGWALTGNSGTNPAVNFLGTTDAQPLVIRVGNQETFRFNPPGASPPAWSIQRGGGDPRGLHAVDLQSARSAATQVASGDYSVIGGGQDNTASGDYATVGGGFQNTASSGVYATVGGGLQNTASSDYATVGGGALNTASGLLATVGGGAGNTASGAGATVGGGWFNTASGAGATVGGGFQNTASGLYATVGGGRYNTASGNYATVGGGDGNTASASYATVGGGGGNIASGLLATVGGGAGNIASGDYSAIPGGYNLRVGTRSFGFSGQTSATRTDLSANSNIAAFVDVDLWLYNVRNQASQLRLYEPSGAGTNFTAFRAQAQASDIIYTLPASLTPTSVVGVGILQTDAFGNLSWLDPSALGGGGAGWALTGNSGTNPTTNFLGTTDAQPLVIRVNNAQTFQFNTNLSLQRDAGGNTRGQGAVDLQSARSAATQVASGDYSVIGGGQDNTASGLYATVGGGWFNTASGYSATVGGGALNTASGLLATVGGGAGNTASGWYATVGGGWFNTASGYSATVGGGFQNTARGDIATVGGGVSNTASGYSATVGGGEGNTASGDRATVGGGYQNTASGLLATVGGGYQNTARGDIATVGGGARNTASGYSATVGGGVQNTASDWYATVGGGGFNTASGWYATVGGGASNTASGDYSAIPGGSYLRVGRRSFGFSGQTSTTQTNLSAHSNIAAFVDVDLWLYSRDRTQASQLRFYEAQAHGSGANYVALRAPTSLSANTTYTLPADLTPTSTVGAGILQTDAFGNLSWLDPSALGGGGAGWALTGNSGTNPAVNFLGTTDAQPLVIRVGNQETFRFNPPGSSAPAWSIQRGGGNTRGLHAVDLQSARSAATQVASGDYSVIGGGQDNTASGDYATVGGGAFNTASGWLATVGGGLVNIASGDYATVGGGEFNTASSNYATVGGGADNTASGALATVGGGARNTASGDYSAIPGGYNLRVGDRSFGFSGQTSAAQTDLSANSNIAAFVDVDLWLYSRDHTQASQLRFYEAQAHGSGANFVALRAPTSLSANTTYTLPASLTPTSVVGVGILQTDAFGNLSWLDPSALGGGGAGWALTGNSGTDPTVNFLGTTDAQPLVIRVNNAQTFQFNTNLSLQRDAGGNTRGQGAVDLQSARAAATRVASGAYSVIGGGEDNTASGEYATVGGGVGNTAGGAAATVGGGVGNIAGGEYSTVGGGLGNAVGGGATVGGGWFNTASAWYATVGGGDGNTASGNYATVGGGQYNTASGSPSTVGGGILNTASGYSATVGGGWQNTASGNYATVGGGWSNTASTDLATVGGGYQNTASGEYATVGGGEGNTASGQFATVGGGRSNTASNDYATVGGGRENTASGAYSVVPGGYSNTANANYNLVFGQDVDPSVTETHRVYFFGDGSAFPSRPSGFLVINRLDGDYPIHVGTNNTNGNGARLTTGGVWTNGSSRSFKERFVQYRPAEVLEKIRQLPVEGYFYKGTEEYHITPMAEDFYRLFGTGVHEIIETDSTGQLVRRPNPDVDKYLAASDVAGVALLGVKALDELISTLGPQSSALAQRLEALEQENQQIRQENQQIRQENQRLRQQLEQVMERLALVEAQLQQGGSTAGENAWLGQNIPNPFAGTTTIPYYIPAGVSRAELVVRDVGGRELKRLELAERGAHGQVVLEMGLLGSGTYEYALVLDGRTVASRQMLLLK
jgi:hypothetical protein